MNMGREAQDEPHESSLPCPTKTLVLRGSQKKPSTRQVDTLGFSKKRHSHSTLPHYSSIDPASLASLQEAIEDLSKAVQQGHRTGQEPAHQGSLEGAGLEREEGWEGTGSCEDEVGNGLKHSLGRGSLCHECGDSLGEDAVGGEGASRWCPSRLPSLHTLSLCVDSWSRWGPLQTWRAQRTDLCSVMGLGWVEGHNNDESNRTLSPQETMGDRWSCHVSR